MKKILLIYLFSLGLASWVYSYQTEYYIYMTLSDTQVLTVLKILPSGEIQDTGLVYNVGSSWLAYDGKHNHLIMANPAPAPNTNGFNVYKIKSDYSLSLFSYMTSNTFAWNLMISNNNDYLIKTNNSSLGEIWSIDSDGNISDTGNRYDPISNSVVISPFDNIAVDANAFAINIYSVDTYNKKLETINVSSVTNISYTFFTPDGKTLIGVGHDIGGSYGINSKELILFNIDTQGNLTTITTAGYQYYPSWGAMHPNGQYFYLYCDSGQFIAKFAYDSVNQKMSYSGEKYYQSGGYALSDFHITSDGKMLVYLYGKSSDNTRWLTAARINDDGSLSWTGYEFPYFKQFSKQLLDWVFGMVIVPSEITAVPEKEWQELE